MHFFGEKILINYYYICSQIDIDFYEVAYQHTSQSHFDRVAPQPIDAEEHNNLPSFFL